VPSGHEATQLFELARYWPEGQDVHSVEVPLHAAHEASQRAQTPSPSSKEPSGHEDAQLLA